MIHTSSRVQIYRIIIPLLLLALVSEPALSKPAKSNSGHAPPQILTLLRSMTNRLEAIRIYMGKPREEIPKLNIENAAPHETYYQAINLYRKADRLALEITRTTHDLEPVTHDNGIGLDAVHAIVLAAMRRIDKVAADLDITTDDVNDKAPPETSVSDLYEAILDASQRINQLLEQPFSPADVYQQVTMALHITQRLYARFPNERRVSRPPEWVPGKRPDDVYRLLLECHDVVRSIADKSHIEILNLSVTPKKTPYQPGEVYDIATLLRSELSYIHSTIPGLSAPATSHFPGRKYPSDVYQRARQLHQTLTRLDALISHQPDWQQPGRTL